MTEIPKFNPQEKEKVIDEKAKNLEVLKDFFDLDFKIKEVLFNSAPPSENDLDYGDGIIYEKTLNRVTDKLDFLFQKLAENLTKLNFSGEKVGNKGRDISKKIKEDILNKSQWRFDNLTQIYRDNFSNLDEKLVKDISMEMIGFYMMKLNSFDNILDKTQTYNEVLHLSHSLVLSDEKLYKKLPDWKNQIKNNEEIECGAYGEKNEFAEEIISYFREQKQLWENGGLEVPTEDMNLFSFDKNIHIMIRNFGHALTINIDLSNNKSALISYGIPKIFDWKRVSQLPGINRVGNSNREGASGQFESNYTNLARDIFELVVRVPTDDNFERDIDLDFVRSKEKKSDKSLSDRIKGNFEGEN